MFLLIDRKEIRDRISFQSWKLKTIKIKNKVMYTTGQKPGKGRYQCTKCGHIITLDDDTDTLPPCKSCNGTKWIKL